MRAGLLSSCFAVVLCVVPGSRAVYSQDAAPAPPATIELSSPLLYSGETLLAPLRELGEALGFGVQARGEVVTLTHQQVTVIAQEGQSVVKLGETTQTLGTTCRRVEGTFYAPLRILEVLLGATLTAPLGTKPPGITLGTQSWVIPFASSEMLTSSGWDALNAGRPSDCLLYARTCLALYLEAGAEQNREKGRFINWELGDSDDSKAETTRFWALNDAAACEWMVLTVCLRAGDRGSAEAAAKAIRSRLSWAEIWDAQGWFWKPAVSLPREHPGL